MARGVAAWRFEPGLVYGKAVADRGQMKLRMAAKPLADGKFAIYIASAGFGQASGAKPTDSVDAREMKPPGFHRDNVRMGGEGVVYLRLKIGGQGQVEDMAVEQYNITDTTSNWKIQNTQR